MIRIFKRRRPRPISRAELITADSDIRIAFYWGLNLVQWHALTDYERAECRRTVTAAPNFGSAS